MPKLKFALVLVLVLIAVSVSSTAAGSDREGPRLGKPWGPYQEGYGKVRPGRIDNGGDPTGDVRHIRWRHWGSKRAVGTGRAVWVRPGTAVSENGFTGGARVVAFHLGKCHGYRSYNAIEWYFPKYGETFDPHGYINACTGAYHGADPPSHFCSPIDLADGSGHAREIEATHIRCSRVRKLIARSRAGHFARNGGQFRIGSYRCGTDGDDGEPGGALFECVKDRRDFLWDLYRH